MRDIEYVQTQIANIEDNLKRIEVRKSEFVSATNIPMELQRDEDKLRSQLAVLRNKLNQLSNATTQNPVTPRQPSGGHVTEDYIDRDEEKQLFRDMIYGQTNIHILLIEAESGMGKTILLDQFRDIGEGFKCARVSFKDASLSLGQILGEMRDQFAPHAFQTFHTECRNLLSQFGGDTGHPALICSKIDAQLNKMSVEERTDHQRVVTDAFLADLEAIHQTIDQPILMFFDVFEKASVPTRTWIAQQLIMQIRRYRWLVCVVAGTETPRIATDGSDWCLQHRLQPLSDEHSREYILLKVKYTQNEELVTFITKVAKGRPAALQQFVLAYLEEG